MNIAGNCKVAAASYSDGTIRWYRMSDGKELLALFPHKDKKRWVLWTPSGYYDASPGAEELIGWHVNRGEDREADFFPVSRFRSVYYRPDVVGKILETLDESEAVRLADEESKHKRQEENILKRLPPVVRILSPVEGDEVSAPEITLKYLLRSPSGEPVTGVHAYIDGRPVIQQRGLKIVAKDETIHEMSLSIPKRDVQISLIAENRYSASEPALVRLTWGGEAREEFVIKPKLYVMAIGVSDYTDDSLDLRYAAKDAHDFSAQLREQSGRLYRGVEVLLLTDEKASKDEILDALDWIERNTTQHDVAMLYLAGHGVNDKAGDYYFLPGDVNLERLRRTGLPFMEIKKTISSLAGKALFFVDTCHSGNIMGARRGPADMNAVVNELASTESGAVVFTASTGNQYSLEDPSWQNGAFTKALVEGLSGKADYSGSGRITVNMLDLYISERVKTLTKGQQTPTTAKPYTVPDFPVVLVK